MSFHTVIYYFSQAGIPEANLDIALEPESASIYCSEEDQEHGLKGLMEVGTPFMIVDLGGIFGSCPRIRLNNGH